MIATGLVWWFLGLAMIAWVIYTRFLRPTDPGPDSAMRKLKPLSAHRLGWSVIILAVIALLIYTRVLRQTYASMAGKREQLAEVASEDVLHVAVVWPRDEASFLNGARLAAAEINESGGVNLVRPDGSRYQRKFRLWEFNEPTDQSRSPAIARSIAFDPEFVATVGYATDAALPASIVFNASGVPFIVLNSSRAATMHDFDHVFRIAPRDDQVARAMVRAVPHVGGQKHIRLALLHPRLLTTRSRRQVVRELTRQVETLVRDNDGNVLFEVVIDQQYERGQQLFGDVVQTLLDSREKYNAVLIADVSPNAENLRRELIAGLTANQPDVPVEIPIIDFNQLDWLREKDVYFRFTPNESPDFFEVVGRLVLKRTRQRAALLIARDDRVTRDQFGSRLAAQIESHIINSDSPLHRLDLAMTRSYDPRGTDFGSLVADLLQRSIDVVFVADNGESTRALIHQLRSAGADQPVICGFGLESLLLCRHDAGLGKTYVASTFNPHRDSVQVAAFLQKYRAEYPETPCESVDAHAAYGYFSMGLLKQAIERAGSSSPRKVSEAMDLFVESDGFLGNNQFFAHGELQRLQFVFKHWGKDGSVNIMTLPPESAARKMPYRRPDSMYRGR